MKKLLILFVFCGIAGWLGAQITLTNASFPAAGDTLKTATDLNPDGVEITPPGGPTNWDFTGLNPSFKSETIYRPASEGNATASFPAATLFAASAGGQGETYYAVSATSFDNLGFSGTSPTGGLPIQTDFHFSPPVPERRAPLHFIDNHLAESSLNIAFAIADLPGGVLDSFPISGLADSIRIRGTASRYDLVDAYGTLSIPGGTYDVLREKRTEYRETRLDIHTFIGWVDITDQAGAIAGLGQDTVVTYNFFSDTEKEPIAVVTTDNSGLSVMQVEFKDNGVVSDAKDMAKAIPFITVSPNPVISEVKFEMENFAPGRYLLQLFDASGAEVLTKKMSAKGSNTEQLDLSPYSSGPYFYRVLNAQGAVLKSGKLLKINR